MYFVHVSNYAGKNLFQRFYTCSKNVFHPIFMRNQCELSNDTCMHAHTHAHTTPRTCTCTCTHTHTYLQFIVYIQILLNKRYLQLMI